MIYLFNIKKKKELNLNLKKSFSLKNAKLSYAGFRDIVKDAVSALGFDPDEYGIHSCHSGGATA